MPTIKVAFYAKEDGSVPVLDWFDSLAPKIQDKCRARIERLQELGHELRRPEADYLREGIYELRAKHAGINYRMLYFFHGRKAVVLSHGFTKQLSRVPEKEIAIAVRRRKNFQTQPLRHTYQE